MALALGGFFTLMIALAKKLNMSQIWKDNTVIPVTVLEVSPNTVSAVRSKDRDGYSAVQLAMGRTKREFREDKPLKRDFSAMKVGDTVTVATFAEGDLVRVSGITKGRGFQGVVKRHGFHGGPQTHGQKNRLRAPGSIGSTAPQRVLPGRRMGGHMGVDRVTIKNLKVVGVDTEKNLLFVRGAVPGNRGGILEIYTIRSQK